MTYALTKEEVQLLSVSEIYEKLSELLRYDEYAWQRGEKLAITYPKRAEGLHLPLYQCKCCKKEFAMESKENLLFCTACGAEFEMDEYGTLKKHIQKNTASVKADTSGEECFIPDWYEWQRQQVKEEIDRHDYSLDCKVEVQALPNAKNFIDCGEGRLIHNEEGFKLTFSDYLKKEETTLTWSPASCFSIHTEYNYRGKGQCVTLSTPDNSYFLFPLEEGFNATKIQFATEYMNEKTSVYL